MAGIGVAGYNRRVVKQSSDKSDGILLTVLGGDWPRLIRWSTSGPSDALQRAVCTMAMRADPGCLLADLVFGHLSPPSLLLNSRSLLSEAATTVVKDSGIIQ